MFDKLKKRLTLIYTGIFSLIMVFVVAVTVAIGCVSVIRTEKEMLIADIYDEWREWIGSGELPVDPALVKKGEMMSLMYDADGNIIIDQMTDSPYAAVPRGRSPRTKRSCCISGIKRALCTSFWQAAALFGKTGRFRHACTPF